MKFIIINARFCGAFFLKMQSSGAK